MARRASLPMYDLPELRESTDALYCEILRSSAWGSSSKPLPSALHRDFVSDQIGTEKHWDDAGLVFTQICSSPMSQLIRAREGPIPLATPQYAFDGCEGFTYRGFIVARLSDARKSLREFAGSRLALNAYSSLSGCLALRAAVAALFPTELGDSCGTILFFDPADHQLTGSHRESLRAVAEDKADVCCIDCITWGLLRRVSPLALEGLVVIGETPAVPAPPFAVRDSTADADVAAVFVRVLEDVCSSDAARQLGLVSVTTADPKKYVLEVEAMEKFASRVRIDGFWEKASFLERLDVCSFDFQLGGGQTEEARIWMGRGQLLAWGFNHGEAIACFEKAAEADPKCAMAHWGIAFCLGINYNKPFLTAEEMEAAYQRILRAAALVRGEEGKFKEMRERVIIALMSRLASADKYQNLCSHHNGELGACATLGKVYADQVRELYQLETANAEAEGRSPSPEIAALYAEALLTPKAWTLWPAAATHGQAEEMEPEPEVADVLRALNNVFATKSGRHPGCVHFYAHVLEAAPKRLVRCAAASDQIHALRSQWPCVGHLVHMASHVDMQVGAYDAAVRGGQRAVEADSSYASFRTPENYYKTYANHHQHQLCWAAMFDGQFSQAMAAVRGIVDSTPPKILEKYAEFEEPLCATVWFVLVRFGRWEEIISRETQEPADFFVVTNAIAAWAKAVAFGALGKIAEARAMQQSFRDQVGRVPPSRHIHTVPSCRMLEVSEEMLEGELLYREGRAAEAFAALRRAADLEDALPYDEPAGWLTPVRHALGGLLAEHAELGEGASDLLLESEAVFKADLSRHPGNVWALTGLVKVLTAMGKDRECSQVAQQARNAARRTDIDVKVSCLCAVGPVRAGKGCC